MAEKHDSMSTFLVEEIRLARLRAGLTQEAFGRAAGFSHSHVSSVETGARPLTRDFAKGADRALKTGGLFERALIRFGDGVAAWFRPWTVMEAEALALRQYEPTVIPGLLQTEDYARTLIAGGGRLSPDQVEPAVRARLDRQALLTRTPRADLAFVVDETALRRNVGGPEMMRAQLSHLLGLIEAERISLAVVPDRIGVHAGIAGNFTLARLVNGEIAGYSESSVAGQIVDRPADLDTLERRWTRLCMVALPPEETAELIRKVAEWH